MFLVILDLLIKLQHNLGISTNDVKSQLSDGFNDVIFINSKLFSNAIFKSKLN